MTDFSQPTDRKTGCLPRDDRLGSEFPVFEDQIDIIPRSAWDRWINSGNNVTGLVVKIKDQNGIGSCASNSATQALEIGRTMEIGTDYWIELAPSSVYWWVSGGRDRGSTISGNLRQLRDVGALPADTQQNKELLRKVGLNPDHVLPNNMWPTRFPDGWEETAKHFRIIEWYDIGSIEGFVSAILLGYPVSYGRDGHSICATEIVKSNGRYKIKYANSWGNWGDDGFGYDNLDYIARFIESYGAWTPRVSVLNDEFLKLVRT